MSFNLADLFEVVADAIPDRPALAVGDQRLTFAELDERTNRLAHHLRSIGVKPGDHVGLHLVNGLPFIEGIVACLKIRAVPINVNYRYVEDELRYLYTNADLVSVLVNEEFAERARRAQAPRPMVVEAEYEAALAAASPDRDFEPRSPDDLYIIYTGGTTGMPKGVMWRQEDLFFAGLGGGNPMAEPVSSPEALAQQVRDRLPQQVAFPAAPLMHGAAQFGTWIGWFWGQKVVLIPKFDPVEALKAIEREGVNTLNLVGDAMARPLAEAMDAGSYDLSTLFVVSSAGAILSDAVKEQLRRHLPNVFIVDGFGATETGFQGSGAEGSSPDKGLRFAMSPDNMVIDEALRPVQPGSGVVGRLARSGHIPLGYYNDPEKTAATFLEIDGKRWVVPGDMATVEEDGTIRVFGRGSVSINTGGEKVYPEEVEAALKSHPAVFDAVVVGVPDERWGQRVAAVVQLRPETTPSTDEIIGHCRSKVAGYKVPRQVHVVDEMRRSPAGKADYQWARDLAAAAKSDVPSDFRSEGATT
jgi:3-oxocholest-4-en-26-oate---CoA ligase